MPSVNERTNENTSNAAQDGATLPRPPRLCSGCSRRTAAHGTASRRFQTLRPFVIEEAYEAVDAIEPAPRRASEEPR